MRTSILVLFFSALSIFSCLGKTEGGLSDFPPRGWNSYDSFSWIISEQEFLDNAKIVADKLHDFGYEYVVIDFLWYRKNLKGVNLDSLGYDNIDKWGRVIPDPVRWPSSVNGTGFKAIADKVHAMGLKFGIHLMRGISAQAVNAKTPILDMSTGTAYREGNDVWNAAQIGMQDMTCGWLKGFMSINTDTGAGKAFLRSLYQQYVDWDIDFVKLDCVFGGDLDSKQILTVSEILQGLNRPIIFSLSPGTTVSPSLAEGISEHVDMYRVTGDDWDKWEDVAVHFDVARDFAAAHKIGAPGLHGKSWPDLDMLPLGWLTDPGVSHGPYRKCSLTLDEQKTQVTLWSMAKSPLMFGGDLRNIDATTLSLITNPTLLEINSYSSFNMEFPHVSASEETRKSVHTHKYSDAKVAQIHERTDLQLVSCTGHKSTGWFKASEGSTRKICWSYEMKISDNMSNCLYMRRPNMTLSGDKGLEGKYSNKFQVIPEETVDTCLDASPYKKLNASEISKASLSTCKLTANQMWNMDSNGNLVNSYSGLCAVVPSSNKARISTGVRAWRAFGRNGEIYLSYFNLNPARTQISTTMSELGSGHHRGFHSFSSCNGTEVWSGRNVALVNHTLSAMVEAHGCALFVLNCIR